MAYALVVGTSLLLGLWFVIAFGPPWRSENPPMAWLQAGLALAAIAFDVVVLLALFRLIPIAWSGLLVLAAQDAVFAWRLAVLLRARRRERSFTSSDRGS